jgi:hypothetical protein
MIAETPEDFTRRVQLHCRADMVEGDRAREIVRTWLDRARPTHFQNGRFAAKRIVAPEGHGFDEVLAIVERHGDEDLRGLIVPLLWGWPLRGAARPDMGDISSDLAMEAVERIRSDMGSILTTDGDPERIVADADRSSCIDVAAMMTVLHPDDEDELVHDAGDRRFEVSADRLTGLPYVRMVDAHFSDDDVLVEDRIESSQILCIQRRHVLHLELRNDRRDPGLSWFVIDRLDGNDEFRTQEVEIRPFDAMQIHAAIMTDIAPNGIVGVRGR